MYVLDGNKDKFVVNPEMEDDGEGLRLLEEAYREMFDQDLPKISEFHLAEQHDQEAHGNWANGDHQDDNDVERLSFRDADAATQDVLDWDNGNAARLAGQALDRLKLGLYNTFVSRSHDKSVDGLIQYQRTGANLHVWYLAAGYPRRGVGTKLMRKVLRDAAGKNLGIELTSSASAIPFYQALGMRGDGDGHFRFTADEVKQKLGVKGYSVNWKELEELEPEDGVFTEDKSRDYHGDHNQEDHGNWANDKQLTSPPPETRNSVLAGLVRDVANNIGMRHFANRIQIHPNQIGPEHTVAGETFNAAANFDPATGSVNLFEGSFGDDTVSGILAHEFSHLRWHDFINARALEESLAVSNSRRFLTGEKPQTRSDGTIIPAPIASKDIDPKYGNHKDDPLMANGELKPEFYSKYPAMAIWNKHLTEKFSELREADGVTDYSIRWWKDSEETKWFQSAINETLAEIARLDLRQKTHKDDSFRKVKSVWRTFYKDLVAYAEHVEGLSKKPLKFSAQDDSAQVFYFDAELNFTTKDKAVVARLAFDDGRSVWVDLTKQKKFHLEGTEQDHDQLTHGSWADGNEGTTGDDESRAQRLKALKVPPAWKDVWLNPDENADLQVTGVDAKGRTQYIYSAAHAERAAAEKFARLKEFGAQLKELRGKIDDDIKNAKDPEDREAAAVLKLIDKTGFRIGSDGEQTGDHKSYGATTLKSNHVTVDGDKVVFGFTGKHGVRIHKTLHDQDLAQLLASRVERGGRLFNVKEGRVREYLKSRAGDFKVKDFRTWLGTASALAVIQKMPKPKDPKALKKAQREVAKKVARALGNTPAVALKSYIDPAVWSGWKV